MGNRRSGSEAFGIRSPHGLCGFAAFWFLCGIVADHVRAQHPLPEDVQPFLAQHCLKCHSGDDSAVGLNLQTLSTEVGYAETMSRWVSVYDRVATGEMPPATESRPAVELQQSFLRVLGATLAVVDHADREVILRRLNRDEYENTVEDLFGISVDLKRLLPEDAVEQGFNNTGSSLSVSAEHLALYLEAADLVLDEVFGASKQPGRIHQTVNFRTTGRGFDDSERTLADGIVLFSGAKSLPMYGVSLPEPGLYRVRMQVRAEQSETPVIMHVLGGNTGAIAPHTVGFFEAPPGQVTTVEFMDRNPERGDCFAFALVGGFPWWKVNTEEYKGPGLFIGDIEIEGPIEDWPPKSRSTLLGEVDLQRGTIDDIRQIYLRQLPLLFRRAVEPAEVDAYVALAQAALDEGLTIEKALRRGLKGMLCAPEFLFLEERLQVLDVVEEAAGGKFDARPSITPFALASRLSYFLWSSLPDKELLALAGSGDLQRPEVLRAEVERMLSDRKSVRFTESFTGQWLRLNDMDFTVPDENLYPEYDQLLRQSMLDETRAYFREILEQDLSVNTFIESDFVMVNEPLARFYGIEGVQGLQIRRVPLPAGSVRGGVLTQASVLKVSADGTRTSPVLRGAWILKHLYGDPSPPPPPTITAIEPDIRGATTIREQLAKHREHESCNSCHRKIDPPGFALESFDVIGAERLWYRTRGNGKAVQRPRHPQAPGHFVQYRQGPDVDASGVMPDGRPFHDIREYRQLLLSDERAMPRALTRLLLSYSLGRRTGFSDRQEIEQIVERTSATRHGLRSLIHQIVSSDVFRRP
ncbi:MAG: DUF1592 domain-containing protein [Planctomycetia bacterium]